MTATLLSRFGLAVVLRIVCVVLLGPANSAAAESAAPLPAAAFGRAVEAGELANPALDEASGLAVSSRSADLLWTVEDSGGEPRLYAVAPDGADRGSIRIDGAENVDWEDLAAFKKDGVAYLLIADVGDNNAKRPFVTLYVVKEPDLAAGRLAADAHTGVAWRIDVEYGDGPRDVEAVSVDAGRDQVLLLSKRDLPRRLYQVALAAPTDAKHAIARLFGEVGGIPPPSADDLMRDPEFGASSSQPTGMDIAPDGSAIVVLTFKNAYLFERSGTDDWAQALARQPKRIVLPHLAQTEAIAFGASPGILFVTTEQRPATLLRLEVPRR